MQVFWAISPEDALYFANPGSHDRFHPAFFFHWGDRDNHIIRDWRELIAGPSHILSVPEAHKLIGYYTIADRNADVLKVCRSYQYTAINAIVRRAGKQRWGEHQQRGGFIWCTTGGGKTMTSFKAGQLILDMGFADKVVFVVDRRALDEQSTREYNSFARDGESVCSTTSSVNLFNKLKSRKADDAMIMTSIQKLANVNEEASHIDAATLAEVAGRRICFIVDEAHRSQFGKMHRHVKDTFYNALFFGFTGTPILAKNMKDSEETTESIFGPCLAVYSLATGIRDGNVLGFWPEYDPTFAEQDMRRVIALREAKISDASELKPGTKSFAAYQYYMTKAPMATVYKPDGSIETKGIEDFFSSADYDSDAHRRAVVRHILDNRLMVAFGGEHGTRFHGMLATSSIPEAYAYWQLFQEMAPGLHVTALFDPNIDQNTAGVIDKEEWLIAIIGRYNEQFDTQFNRRTDPHYERFKSDLTARLAHKKPYQHIANDAAKCLDLVIVVDQLLTGFDSVYLNVLYMDKVMESDALIQAISRTNRIYDNAEKPWGMVKFYRKTHSMRRNLQDALELYCEGDTAGVMEQELMANLHLLNALYENIAALFEHEGIERFCRLPKDSAAQQKFRKDFTKMRSTLRAAFLQGFQWSGAYAGSLVFDEMTYHILRERFRELPSTGTHSQTPRAGYQLETNLTSVLGEQIDSDYLESRFKILTISDIEARDQEANKAAVMKDIEANLGILPARLQPYARQVLDDIQSGTLCAEPGKRFRTYITEYREHAISHAVHEEAAKYGIDEAKLLDVYRTTGTQGINQIALKEVENTADITKIMQIYGCSRFAAKSKLHAALTNYISAQRAEAVDVQNTKNNKTDN
ncbi:type I restriction endonuclease subunit R, EcoR124 family [Selenomonas sp.]|uniref:type I restriction endonuclease subunit R, EcoR124 family n=1 Tax=Selenomonas sp. TaxID=2053611 RepID=UPI003A0FE887